VRHPRTAELGVSGSPRVSNALSGHCSCRADWACSVNMQRPVRVQMLLTDAFGGFGGISKFNREFLAALNACSSVECVHALPRLITEQIEEVIPEAVIFNRKAARGRVAFARQLLRHACRAEQADLIICGHLHLLPLAWLTARHQQARLALVIHGFEAFAPTRNRLSNLVVDRIDAFIAVSRYSADRFVQWSNVARDRGFILPNCVDVNRFTPGERDRSLVDRYGLHSSKVMLTVGRMAAGERYKGFDEVIDAMPRLLQRFPDLKYLIVGDGSDRRRLEATVKVLGLSNCVIFAGRIPESEKVAHYHLADVFVMPSYGEGFGIVLIEAAACGIPIVGSSADGSRDALLDGRLGRMVDPKKPDEVVEAITDALRGAGRRARNDLVATFNVGRFRARVAHWIDRQTALAAA
jgi:phosphatidylinositol alpha-1,6-mannosyltransferase